MKNSNRWALALLSLSLTTTWSFGAQATDYGPPIFPSFEQLMGRLKKWGKDHSRLLTLRDLGKSLQGRPLIAAVLTDPDALAQDKEHVLITAQHCGGERSAATEGFVLYVCATSTAAAREWLAEKAMPRFATKIAGHPAMEGKVIRQAVANLPDAPGHFDAHLYLEKGDVPGSREKPIEHGLALRLRIPYSKARITDLRLNGRPVSVSESDGYLTWVARGFIYVQLNIPPERCLKDDLFVITCAYDPGERRRFGLGWQE